MPLCMNLILFSLEIDYLNIVPPRQQNNPVTLHNLPGVRRNNSSPVTISIPVGDFPVHIIATSISYCVKLPRQCKTKFRLPGAVKPKKNFICIVNV